MNNEQKRFKLFIGIGVVIFIAVIIIGIMATEGVFHKNPYGDQIKIDNYDKFYPDTPTDRRDSIFATLYRAITENVENVAEIPKSGALIRKGTNETTNKPESNITSINFIVDIAKIQQSYQVQYEWADNKEGEVNLSGYQGIVTCIRDPQYIIYQSFKCKDMFTDDAYSELTQKYPIVKELPLIIDEYSKDFGTYTHYTINYDETTRNNSMLELIITDYTGNNYEKAVQKIKDLGYNPNDYKITYDNIAGFAPGKAE